MTLTRKLCTSAAAIGIVAAMAMPAAAMTCVDFVNMSADDRMKAAEEMDMGGRMAARDAANNAASGGSDGDAAVSVVDKADADGGQEAQRDMGRGEDVVMRVIEDCARSSSSDLDSIIGPTQ